MSILKQGVLIALGIQIAGCSAYVPGDDGESQLSEQSEDLVGRTSTSTTGVVTKVDRTSETTAVLAADMEPVVAFNRNDDAHTFYPSENDRAACRGGVNLGFAKRSTGWQLRGMVLPVGYALLWGDPALAGGKGTVVTPAASTLFLSTLAAPNDRFDAAVQAQGSNDGCFHGGMDGNNSPLAGACIARSEDNGASFHIDPSLDCVRAGNDFYDGGSVTVSRNTAYAAYVDENTEEIHVYRTLLGTHREWLRMANPFPGLSSSGHPLIYADNAMAFVIAPTNQGFQIAAFNETTLKWSAPQLVAAGGRVLSVHLNNNTDVRSMGGYDAAIGHSGFADTRLKFVYSTVVNGKAELRSADCALHPTISCTPGALVSEAGFNAFLPSVAFAQIPGSGEAPSTGVWHVSYQSDGGTDVAGAVKLRSIDFDGGASKPRTAQQVPCSDDRGYWGDYDAMIGFNATSPTSQPTFMRFVTDSTVSIAGSCQATTFDANAQRVSFVRWSL